MDCLILCWNEGEVVRDSVRILLKEGHRVIVVDNGSTDGSKEILRSINNPNFVLVDLPENTGQSVGRNKGIELLKSKYTFMLDGDILYVKGTINEYAKILDMYPDAGCVGQHKMEDVFKFTHNGVPDPSMADFRMSTDYEIIEGFPMAWTQYGLFRTKLLKKYKFVTEGNFGEPGYGFEDDFLYHEMKRDGWSSLELNKPAYFHFAHASKRLLSKEDYDNSLKERGEIFHKHWDESWVEFLNKGKYAPTRRNNPNTPGQE